ncbi:MAG: MFS transporter [Burkholderiales bacterium]|nr:MFS transporter [Burkholderiales bacterium]
MRQATESTRLTTVLLASGIILSLAMGVRHGFGFWLQPVSQHHDWARDTFSLAMALQNLMWGVFGPVAGMAADRFGAPRVVLLGALLYMGGLLAMANAVQPSVFVIGSGVLIGAGLSCTAFGALSGVVGRTAPIAQRSWAFGVLGAAGSFGQFAMVPVEQLLIANTGWQGALYCLAAAVVVLMIPLSFMLREPPELPSPGTASQSISEAMREAFAHRPFRLLVAGYFVCGFQVVFIGVHLPSYLKDRLRVLAFVTDIRLFIRGFHGAVVVVYRAADQWRDCRYVWCTPSVDVVGLCFFLAPAG